MKDAVKENHVWGFDMGKASLGEAVFKDGDFAHVESLILDEEFGEIKTAAATRRFMRTRAAHKMREQWLEKCLEKFGIETLKRRKVGIVGGRWKLLSKADERLEREFPRDGENICYNSIALRCKLLLGEKLESWQVFKALNSAIQNRGYDEKIPWKESEKRAKKDDDDYALKLKEFEKEKDEMLALLPRIDAKTRERFDYPCFFKAYRMGLWSPESPETVQLRIDNQSERAKGYVVPRDYVVREFSALVEMAARQYPKLKGKVDFIMFGVSETQYASSYPRLREKFGIKRGADTDLDAALGQKIPRFDNRIIDKCRLIPRLNVCKIKKLDDITKLGGEPSPRDLLPYEITLAMKLLNLRFFRNGNEDSLSFEEFKSAFKLAAENKYKFTKTSLKKFLKGISAEPLGEEQSEIEAPAESGRASFSRPAMALLKELIFSGETPAKFYAKKSAEITNTNPEKGLVAEDLDFIRLMGDAPWKGIFIPDVETYRCAAQNSGNADSAAQIRKIIGSQNDPIVRHRLGFFYERIKMLQKKFGTPDKIVLEFVRDDFIGKEKKKEISLQNAKRFKEKLEIAKELDEANLKGAKMLVKLELLRKQGGMCIYTGEPISPSDLPDMEIEHIVPRSRGGPDAIYNYVITREKWNKEKGDRTPYEWLSSTDKWASYSERVKNRAKELGKKRCELLLSAEAENLVEKYTALAETAWIAKLAQRIACLHFGFQFGGNTGAKRVFTISGGTTARIRGTYGLNAILHNTTIDKSSMSEVDIVKIHEELEKKNRKNKKHHALDAMCLCFAPTGANARKARLDQIFPPQIAKDAEAYFRGYLDNIVPNEVAPKKPRLEESIYSKRVINGKECIVKKFNLVELAYKSGIKPVYDLNTIKKTIDSGDKGFINPVVRKIVKEFVDTNPTEEEWRNWCETARIPARCGEGTRIKRALVFVGNPDEFKDLSKDACGAFRRGDAHKGQIIWKTKSGKYCVAPIYVHASKQTVIEELKKNKDFAEIAGIFRSHCLVELADDVHNKDGIPLLNKGIYMLNTIIYTGQCILTSPNGEKNKAISINYLMQAGMKRIILSY